MSNDYDDLKIPPHDTAAEQSVIGGLMLAGLAQDGSAFDVVASLLTAADFYNANNRLVFGAIADLAAKGSPADLVTLPKWLADRGELDNAGGFAYLATLAKDTPSAANIKAYAEIVRDTATKRHLLAFAAEMTEWVFRGGSASGAELLARAESKVFALTDKRSNNKGTVVKFKQGVKKVLRDMDERSKLNPDQRLLGVSTGNPDLDEMTSGLCGGDLVIVAGRPSMGKSAAAGDLELAAALQGKPVASFTLEMPYEQVVMRMLSRQSSVELTKIRKSWKLEQTDYAKIGSALSGMDQMGKPFADLPLYIIDQPGISVSEIRRDVRRLHRQSIKENGVGLGMVTIDYLQLMGTDVGESDDNRSTSLGKITGQLKVMAKELNIPVILLSQLNRSLEQRPNKRPIMSDLRESGAVEQDADMIIFIYRDEVYRPDSEFKGTAEFIVAKQRNGPTGMVRLTSQLQYTRFRAYSPEIYEGGYH